MKSEWFFFANTLSISVASAMTIAVLVITLKYARRNATDLALVFAALTIAGWVVPSFFEIFFRSTLLSFSIAASAGMMTVALLLLSLTIFANRFTVLHWLVAALAIPAGGLIAIPGVVYSEIARTLDGYVELIPGPFYNSYQSMLMVFIFGTVGVYVYRAVHERDYVHRHLLRVLCGAQLAFIVLGLSAIVVLPAFGYSEWNNLGTAFGLTPLAVAVGYVFLHIQSRREV